MSSPKRSRTRKPAAPERPARKIKRDRFAWASLPLNALSARRCFAWISLPLAVLSVLPLFSGCFAAKEAPGAAARASASAVQQPISAAPETGLAETRAAALAQEYQAAHRMREVSFEKSIQMFRDVADHAQPPLSDRALLQIAVIYRIGLMEPRLALGILDEFLARPSARDFPSYERFESDRLTLHNALEQVDILERRLADPSQNDQPATVTLTLIAEVYRNRLDAPNYAFGAYKRAFAASSEKLDTACYMMGHCKMDLAEYPEAIALFEDFQRRFPRSPLYASAIELTCRSKFLQMHSMSVPFLQAAAAANLIVEIDGVLAEKPDLDPKVRERLRLLRKLSRNYLPGGGNGNSGETSAPEWTDGPPPPDAIAPFDPADSSDPSP